MRLKDEINGQLHRYSESLLEFIESHKVPPVWLSRPDHLAIKVENAAEYQRMLLSLEPMSDEVYATPGGERFLGAAKLLGEHALKLSWDYNGSPIEWVEVIESRPKDVAANSESLDHVEFYYPNLPRIQDYFGVDILPFPKANDDHSWIELPINLENQRVIFTDKRLAAIIRKQKDDGRARLVYSRKY